MVTAKKARPCCGCKKPVTDPYKKFGLVYWCKECWEKWIERVDKLPQLFKPFHRDEKPSMIMQEAEKYCLSEGVGQISLDGPTGVATLDLDAIMAEGGDVYAEMSVALFGKVTSKTRRACKNMIFRALYYGERKGTE